MSWWWCERWPSTARQALLSCGVVASAQHLGFLPPLQHPARCIVSYPVRSVLACKMVYELQDLPSEVLKRVCSHCAPDALVYLALTCRLFSEYALPSLWHTLTCFAVLVYTLPREAWRSRSVESPNISYSRARVVIIIVSDHPFLANLACP